MKDKIYLITGGTGSFGSTVANLLLSQPDTKEVRIFSRDEKKQEEMRLKYNTNKLKFYIGDVRNYDSIYYALNDVDFVFHAAALKQVPSCEFYPMEAIRTNVLGSENLINASIEKKIKKVILLSTDKAVYPVNAMGLSKSLMEKLMLAKSINLKKNETILCATRYGNVLGSRGSVVPLFLDQISKNKTITITDLTMTRFLMTLEDSVNLVFYAFKHGQQGDILVQKSPACSIGTLVDAIETFIGKSIKKKTIGIRHGEKDFETLISKEEMTRVEEINSYFIIKADLRDLNYDLYFNKGSRQRKELHDYSSNNAYQLDKLEVQDLLKKAKLLNNAQSK